MPSNLAKALPLLLGLSSLPTGLLGKSLHPIGEFWSRGAKHDLSVDSDSIKQVAMLRQFNLHSTFEKPQARPGHPAFQKLIFAYQVDCMKRAYSVSMISFYVRVSDDDSAPESVLSSAPDWTAVDNSEPQAQAIDYVCSR